MRCHVVRHHGNLDTHGFVWAIACREIGLAQFVICKGKDRLASIKLTVITAGINKTSIQPKGFSKKQFCIDILDIGDGVSKLDHLKGPLMTSDRGKEG